MFRSIVDSSVSADDSFVPIVAYAGVIVDSSVCIVDMTGMHR
jgi:hypothetical protein